eukprot:g40288.t1
MWSFETKVYFSVYKNAQHLTVDERKSFIDNMFTALGYDIEEEYGDLFDRIDVARDGFVDWNKVTTFMLLELYENEERTKSSLVPRWKEIKFLPMHHKEPIQTIVYLKNSHRYLSLSKEGWMNVWGENLKLQQTLRVTTDSVRLRDLWVTSMVSLTNVNKGPGRPSGWDSGEESPRSDKGDHGIAAVILGEMLQVIGQSETGRHQTSAHPRVEKDPMVSAINNFVNMCEQTQEQQV